MESEKLDKRVLRNVAVALNHIENAYASLKLSLSEEKDCNEARRNELYDYGISDAQIHLVKLSNVKKALLSITGNRSYKNYIA